MEDIQLRASEVAYHLERLKASKTARKTVERRDEGSFRRACRRLRVPEKYVDSLVKIVFSSNPEPMVWPWG